MTARNRSTSHVVVSGGRYFNNNPSNVIGAGLIQTGFSSVDDIIGYGTGDCAPFSVDRKVCSGGVIERHNAGSFASTFDNYPCDWLRTLANAPHLSVSGVPSNVQMATEAAARTNPSRPYVDVPVNILDLRGGVQRIQHAGDDLIQVIRRSGGRYLNYKFMIRPLVGDIVKLVRAQDQINRRIQEINRLYDGHGIRRTVSNGTFSTSSTSSATVQSAGVTINRTFERSTRVVCRTHVRWKPASRCGIRPPPEVIQRWATRAVHGLTLDFSTLWEITPWSWLVDWFGDVGTYLKATRNIIPAQLTGVHPMKHTMTTWSCPGTVISNGTISGINVSRETKTRSTSFVAPSAFLSFLTGEQMSILAALAAARAR